VVKSYAAKTFRHIYWEVRFDARAKRSLWDLSREIASLPQHDEDDELLERVVKRTLFSFKTDKRIFHSLLILNRMDQWQKMLHNLSEKSPWKLADEDVDKYKNLSYQTTFDFLTHLQKAECIKSDPIGSNALLSARWIRKNLRMLNRKGKLEPNLYRQALRSLEPEPRIRCESLG